MLRHYESTATLNTSAQSAFEFLDDPKRLSSHMSKSSWMMAGSKMDIEVDSKLGRGVDSEMTLRGRIMGHPSFRVRKKHDESSAIRKDLGNHRTSENDYLLGANVYAKWCVDMMVQDSKRHFG